MTTLAAPPHAQILVQDMGEIALFGPIGQGVDAIDDEVSRANDAALLPTVAIVNPLPGSHQLTPSFHKGLSGGSSSSIAAKRAIGSRKKLSLLSSLTWLTSPTRTGPPPFLP